MSLCLSSPVKKALQFDSEPQKESSSSIEAQSSEFPVPSSLLHLVGQLAETSEDKYQLLEQKDKVLRQGEACTPTRCHSPQRLETETL